MAENTPISNETIGTTPTPPTTGVEAISFEETYRAMNIGLQYVNETRADFEKNGPQKWISDLVILLSEAAKKIRSFELEHTDDTVLWRDESGVPHEVLVRMQDEKRFDEVLADYQKAEDAFEDYFLKHVELTHNE